jgi:hypothetical protein
VAEQGEPDSAVHLSRDPFGPRVDTLGAAVVVGQGQAGVDGGPVEVQAVRGRVQVWGRSTERTDVIQSVSLASLPSAGVSWCAKSQVIRASSFTDLGASR